MEPLRALILRQRLLAMLVLAAALVLKAVLPGGTMLSEGPRTITVALCADASGGLPQQLTIALDRKAPEQMPAHGKHQGTCVWSAHAMPALGGADAVLLALALAFILALGLVPSVPARIARPAYLRPPLRGPPSPA